MTALGSVCARDLSHVAFPRPCTTAAHFKVRGSSLGGGAQRTRQDAGGVSALRTWALPMHSPGSLGGVRLSALGLWYGIMVGTFLAAGDGNTLTGLKRGRKEFNGCRNWQVQQ